MSIKSCEKISEDDSYDFWSSNSIMMSFLSENEKKRIKPVIGYNNMNKFELILPNLQFSENKFYFKFNKNIGIIHNYSIPKICCIPLKEKYIFSLKNVEFYANPLKKNNPNGLLTEISFPRYSELVQSDIINYSKSIELLMIGFPDENTLKRIIYGYDINQNNNNVELEENYYEIDKIIEEHNSGDELNLEYNSSPHISDNDENDEDYDDNNEY